MALDFIVDYVGRAVQRVFGSRNERLLKGYRETVARITALEPEFEGLSDEELAAKTPAFRRRLAEGETLDGLLVEAFATAREAAKRCVWLGYEAAPEDHYPEIQERIRQAMRGKASLIDPDTGKPIETHGLYGMRPYDVQLAAGIVLHEGRLAELATGEGKTLCAAAPCYLNALAGKVHVVSVNDFLVRRDALWNRPLFSRLGLTVGSIQARMEASDRQEQYACDIIYGTNSEFGFDYLRDNMKTRVERQVQGPLAFAIVDEADSVLVDEARTPLIISGPAFESTDKYQKADAIARQLKPDRDFEVKEKEHQCPLTEEGVRRAEEIAGIGSFYIAGNMDWPHLLDQALRAHHLYKRDKHYVVKGDEVIIVDEFTGRLMPGRQWSDGLHQAVEAKERIRIKEETQTLATITLQNYFRMYDKLAGMTATAMTEAGEFDKIYDLEVVAIPTNRPLSRIGHSDLVFRTLKEKLGSVVDEIKTYHEAGRPVLVGTTSVEMSERLSNMLTRRYGIEHEVLNAKYHEKEAQIVAKAGQQHEGPDGRPRGNVTIATNMAGRGTDIKLGEGVVYRNCYGPWDLQKQSIPSDFGFKCCVGCPEYDPKTNCAHCFKPKVDPAFPERGKTECVKNPPCGLHVVGTERHEARRIDNQLRGRSGRQGDPGSSRFFLSLEDDLMRIFARDWVSSALGKLGMEEGMALEHRWLTRGIENAQKKVEERNFGFRKRLLEYDEVMDEQRRIFYGRRQSILEAENLRDVVWDLLTESIAEAAHEYLPELYSYETAAEWAGRTFGLMIDAGQIAGKDAEDVAELLRDQASDAAREAIEEGLAEFVPDPLDYAEDERVPGPDYQSLVRWAQSRLNVDLKESELKRTPIEDLPRHILEAAEAAFQEVDCSPLEEMLSDRFRREALADWTERKFELGLTSDDFDGLDTDAAARFITDRIEEVYRHKERTYPIEFAIEDYLSPGVGHGENDFQGLAEWASGFYLTDVAADDIRAKNPMKVRDKLLEVAREFDESDRLASTVDEGVGDHAPASPEGPDDWQPLAAWTERTLGLEVTPSELHESVTPPAEDEELETPAPPRRDPVEAARELLLERARADRRSRMTELERYLLLQVHDSSWKDHLLTMDHLRESVGLRGYAQKDPLIEYKREGLESFEKLLDSARDKFTDLFFKARWVRQDALGRIWAGQSSEHAVAESAYEAQREQALKQNRAAQMAGEGESAVDTIVREQPKVGRNDPCPCGSGKKYKKCCGRRA